MPTFACLGREGGIEGGAVRRTVALELGGVGLEPEWMSRVGVESAIPADDERGKSSGSAETYFLSFS